MDYDHVDMLSNIVSAEIRKLPQHMKEDIFSSEENFSQFVEKLGFRVGFQAGAYYGVRGGAELVEQYYEIPEMELDAAVDVGDALMTIVKGVLGI